MPKLKVELRKPEANDKEFRIHSGQRQVRVKAQVSNETDPANVKVKAGTGATLPTTVPATPLSREGATSIWSGWVDLDYVTFFVRVLAVEGTKDAYDHGGPFADNGP